MSTTKWENYNVEIQNNIQTAGSLEATKTERQRQSKNNTHRSICYI